VRPRAPGVAGVRAANLKKDQAGSGGYPQD
jgi:hypothetical protein